MKKPDSRRLILERLKMRGAQSVKILAQQLDMTTMGMRQHLGELADRGLVEQTEAKLQTRGRPLRLWKLSGRGHREFPDGHTRLALDLVEAVRDGFGQHRLDALIDDRDRALEGRYRAEMNRLGNDLESLLEQLRALRSAAGYMAELRLVPDGWLLIENHCPVNAAARCCPSLCESELGLFQRLLAPHARVERVEHLLAGARRCAWRITRRNGD